MADTYRGSCLCGGVTFSAGGFDAGVAHCHCTMCRKFHGAAFGTLAGVSSLAWRTGEDLLRHFTGHNGTVRTFCSRCGASIAFRSNADPGTPFEIALSLFDEEIPVKPDAHIFTNYKGSWYSIEDSLPQFGESRSK